MKQASTMQGRHNANPSNHNTTSQGNRQQADDYNLPSIGSDRPLDLASIRSIGNRALLAVCLGNFGRCAINHARDLFRIHLLQTD